MGAGSKDVALYGRNYGSGDVGHKLYSRERLLETIRNHASSSSKGMIEAILIDVNEFVSGALQSDDQTLLSISFYPETEE